MDIQHLDGQPVIIGAGIAGLMTALSLAPRPVTLLSEGPLGGESSSALAQGGLAASCGDDDTPELHLEDTLAAGDHLGDAEMARRITEAAPAAVERLARLGVLFDRNAGGSVLLGLEGAHSRRRIVHAAEDGTGRAIMQALIEAARRTPSIRIIEGTTARRVIVRDNAVAGVLAAHSAGVSLLVTPHVVIATGGIGGLFTDSSNPACCFGHGLALAAHAGATLADLEFIQFHPTALDVPTRPMPLISEAVRGEGAVLIDERGERFMADEPGAELAPRDVVARAVWRQIQAGRRVFLDAREALGARFATRFPGVTALCRKHGFDPAAQPIPIRPASHYHMGGIAVDAAGRSSVAGLWACGEAACTGLHGANRLASNSLTEAVVCAGWIAEDIAATVPVHRNRTPRIRMTPPSGALASIRPIISRAAGVLRSGEALRKAVDQLLPIAAFGGGAADAALVALMITKAALRRKESRGAHHRIDFPLPEADAERSFLSLDDVLSEARQTHRRTTIFAMENRP